MIEKVFLEDNDPRHTPIYIVADRFEGNTQGLIMLIQELLKKNMKIEAKGIWIRNDLENHPDGQDIRPLIQDIKFDKEKDSLIFEDKF